MASGNLLIPAGKGGSTPAKTRSLNFLNDPRTSELQKTLARRDPRLIAPDAAAQRAAVALIVRTAPRDLELLFIERPISPSDPWSGHIAFPGGRRNAGEEMLDTAMRETKEEVGIDLPRNGVLLGRLDDIQPTRGGPQLAVAAFVFAVPEDTVVRAQPREVAQTFWVPIPHLADPRSAAEHLHILEHGDPQSFPAVSYKGHVIWGLTYRMLMQFLEIARMAKGDSGTGNRPRW